MLAIWIRLPQASSTITVVTGALDKAGWVKRTPSATSRSYSAPTSSTPKLMNGIPSLTSIDLNTFAAGARPARAAVPRRLACRAPATWSPGTVRRTIRQLRLRDSRSRHERSQPAPAVADAQPARRTLLRSCDKDYDRSAGGVDSSGSCQCYGNCRQQFQAVSVAQRARASREYSLNPWTVSAQSLPVLTAWKSG